MSNLPNNIITMWYDNYCVNVTIGTTDVYIYLVFFEDELEPNMEQENPEKCDAENDESDVENDNCDAGADNDESGSSLQLSGMLMHRLQISSDLYFVFF